MRASGVSARSAHAAPSVGPGDALAGDPLAPGEESGGPKAVGPTDSPTIRAITTTAEPRAAAWDRVGRRSLANQFIAVLIGEIRVGCMPR